MSMKGEGPATEWREIDEWTGGTGWLAYPEEGMQRASHALDGEEGLWLVDPVDFPALDEFLAERGEVRGIVLLLNRHKRDAAAIARRHDVAVHVPHFMDGVLSSLDAEVKPVRHELPDSEYGVHEVIDNPFWKEALLYGEETDTLVVGESVGTNEFNRTREERLGVHPMLRLTPPRILRRLEPERILVGHGEGVFENAAAALTDALDNSRRRAPRVFANSVRALLS
jgi:hypothetical protein